MAGTAVDFLAPVGRLVQGNCFEPQTKDHLGNDLVYKNGPNAGKPKVSYFIAVAYSKTDPAWPAFHKLLEGTARRDFPALFPNPNGPCVNPNFAIKIVDGDGTDQTGKANASKDGFAGHWVVRFSTQFPPKCFAAGKYQPHEQLQIIGGVNPIPRGYKVRVAGTVKGNDDPMKPGLHVSHSMVEFSAVDTLIVSGPDAAAVFGGGAAPAAAGGLIPVPGAAHTIESLRASKWTDDQIVNGGFATRAAPAPAAPPPPAAAPAAPPPPAPAPAAPPPPVTPHTAILSPPARIMLPAAGGVSYEDHLKSGWTDETLIQHGRMQAPVAAAPAPPPLATGGSAPPPPPAAIAAAPPPPPGKVMLPAAGAVTYDAYIASGWTDAMLVQNGFMAA